MKISDNPLRLTCPRCGKLKHIRTILSGNTIGARCWSDGRWYYPMMEQPSPYQKCPKCRHYFLLSEAKPTMVKLTSPNTIDLTFDEPIGKLFADPIGDFPPQSAVDPEVKAQEDKLRKEASRNGFGELALYELAEAGKDILSRCKTGKQKKEYYLAFVHKYNDAKTGRNDSGLVIMLEDYRTLFEEYAKELSIVRGKSRAINAEMCRELGQFDRAIEICHRLLDAGTDVESVRQILAHAEAHDPEVFELQFEEKEL